MGESNVQVAAGGRGSRASAGGFGRGIPDRLLRAGHGWNLLGLPIVILLMVLYFYSRSGAFLTASNFDNIARTVGPIALLALAQGFVILLGEVDISAGAIVGLSTVTAALAVDAVGTAGLLAAPLTGLAVGLVNGGVVSRFAVSAVIVTIGTMTAVRGVAFTLSGGQPLVADFPAWFAEIGVGKIGPLPVPLCIGGVAFALAILTLRYTRFGPMLYATGGNEEAARLAGLPVLRIKLAAFSIAGTLAGVAGLIYAARINSGQANLGAGLELQAIAAAVIGGLALTGGEGRMTGVVLGVVVLTVLQNGLDIINVSSYTQSIVIGGVILIAIVVDRLRARGRGGTTRGSR